MASTRFPFERFLGPRYWPTWVLLAILWCVARLPYRLLYYVGNAIGLLMYYLPLPQRKVAFANIKACLRELSPVAQRDLLRRNMMAAGLSLFEAALSLFGNEKKLQAMFRIVGLENVQAALQQGRGAIVMGGHMMPFLLVGRLLAAHMPYYVTVKPARNKLFEAITQHVRLQHYAGVINSRDLRGMLKHLKQNEICWYSPDQDFGREQTVFAPFMGEPAASLTMPARLAKASRAPVLPLQWERLPQGRGYQATLLPALGNFPSDDEIADARRVNDTIELNVRKAPEQYLWLHRRFKTRPIGVAALYKPKRDKSLKLYRRLLFIIFPIVVVVTLWQAIKAREPRYFFQRLGWMLPPHRDNEIWVHAASVGEVNAIIPLIEAMIAKNPEIAITLSTITPTGARNARGKLPPGCRHIYLPLDYLTMVKRFIKRLQPRCGLIVETEIWPQLFWTANWKGVMLILVNARLSHRARLDKYWIQRLTSYSAQQLSGILARSTSDAEKFIALNPTANNVKVIGNIKLAIANAAVAAPIDLGRPYVLAASTRDNEEAVLLSAWKEVKRSSHLLVIAPRHPQRRDEIIAVARQRSLNIAIRSRGDQITAATQVYIADTFGELRGLIAGSSFVIMGGSFVAKGGQNILEVAHAGKAVVFGPHMENFIDESQRLLSAAAAIQVDSADELPTTLSMLLEDKSLCDEMGEKGKQCLQGEADIVERYLSALQSLCKPLQPRQKSDTPAITD